MSLFSELNKRVKGRDTYATWYTKKSTEDKFWIEELCDLLDEKLFSNYAKKKLKTINVDTLEINAEKTNPNRGG